MLNLSTNNYNSVSIELTNCVTVDEFIIRVYRMDLQILTLNHFYNLINNIMESVILEQTD